MNGRIFTTMVGSLLVALHAPSGWTQDSNLATDRYGDPLPAQVLARLGTIRFRQAGMRQVLWFPDGKTLATIGDDNAITFWDQGSGKRVRTIARHKSRIQCAAFSADGSFLASLDYDGNLIVSEASTGKELQRFTSLAGKIPNCIAVSPDGKMIACGSMNAGYQVWNLETGKLAHEGDKWSEHRIHGAEFSGDGKLLAVGSTRNDILLLDSGRWKTVKTLTSPDGGLDFRFFPGNRGILFFGSNWFSSKNMDTGKVTDLVKHDAAFYGSSLHPNGNLVATGSARGYFKVWDLAAGKLLIECATSQLYVFSLAFSPDGNKLATCSDGSLEVWDTKRWERLSGIDAPTQAPNLIEFTDQGKRIVSIHDITPHFQVRHWDVANSKVISFVQRHDGGLFRRALAGEGRWVVGWQGESAFDEKKPTIVRVWDSQSGDQRFALENPRDMGNIAVSKHNHHLLVRCGQNRFVFFDLTTGKLIRNAENKEASSYSITLSPQADWVAAPYGRRIAMWNASTGEREQEFGARKSKNRLLTFFPIGRALADGVCAENSSFIEIWEPYSGRSRRLLPEATEILNATAVSPDGRLIAAGYPSGAVHIWDVATEKQLARLEGHSGLITSLAFSPDSRTLASASADTTILLWKVPAVAKFADRPTEKVLEQCWNDLADANAKTAFSAILTLAEYPAQSLVFLQQMLDANPALSLEGVPQLLADLDSSSFQAREQASQSLVAMGNLIRPALNQVLKDSPSLEVRRRCDAILKRLGKNELQPAELRIHRVAETLQLIGTPQAQKLLKRFLPI